MDIGNPIAVAGVALGGLAAVVWWVIRYTHGKVETEGTKREQAIKEERQARDEDRHVLRNEINNVGAKLQQHELHVAREYVNHDRLALALKPLEDGVGRVEGTLERLFHQIDGKQDKKSGGDD